LIRSAEFFKAKTSKPMNMNIPNRKPVMTPGPPISGIGLPSRFIMSLPTIPAAIMNLLNIGIARYEAAKERAMAVMSGSGSVIMIKGIMER
jgi:hypothetical protein